MINCRNVTRLLSEAQERPLSITERVLLKLHVAMCSGCQNFKDQMGTLRLMTRAYAKRKSDHDE
ncbi:zf-HC2 domain-containing protein [Candidatus Nitrotoga sp. M5]|uniref:zf-HC2 domain-containing protein n=1 Tax=Candidatus Nitrotoga sp. M5 TaxID=2890409 RepID=UPI001EF41093|nr:zf-HC2 domain-containing protein [Candidatus Nitrotoga sp. M5]CAH1387878.1 putative zinc-finger [Candidatus Nitrotoga sp. M5]